MQSRWRLAIDALRPLSLRPEIVDDDVMAFDFAAWVALVLGAALAIWISQSIAIAGWLFGYTVVANITMFGLMALSIYDGLRRAFSPP